MARKKRKRPHHTGSYQYRDGRHVVQWTENGQRRTKTLASAEEVPAFLARACGGLEAKRGYSGKLSDLATTWLAGREDMASNYDYRNRWANHLEPLIGFLTPDQVDVPVLKRVIQELKAKGLSKGTVGLCLAVVSSLFGDLVEDGVAKLNPVRMLSRKTRARELVSDRDWKKTPFVRTMDEVKQIHLRLSLADHSVAVGYIVGALAGLRTSEVRALRWGHVDLDTRLIHVQEQVARRATGTTDLKDDDSRFVPISDALFPYLQYQMRTNPEPEQLVCTLTGGFMNDHRMGKLLAQTLAAMEIRPMRWYEATRHTFASQWVINGGSLETLREMMGHSSVTTTERYAHLVPGLYSDADRARVAMPAEPAPARMVN
jgi:integrase